MVVLDTGTSSDESGDAIEALRKIAKKQCFISGMTAGLIDTKALADKEAPVYVILAVILCLIVLQLTMDSFMAPLLFLVSIGMAVLYNMGEPTGSLERFPMSRRHWLPSFSLA
jgi:predicted RND superfamily exporter protein